MPAWDVLVGETRPTISCITACKLHGAVGVSSILCLRCPVTRNAEIPGRLCMTAMDFGQCLSRELAWTMRGMYNAAAAVQGHFGTEVILPGVLNVQDGGSLQM